MFCLELSPGLLSFKRGGRDALFIKCFIYDFAVAAAGLLDLYRIYMLGAEIMARDKAAAIILFFSAITPEIKHQ